MADRDSRSHYNKIVNMTAAINIDFNLSSINHDVAKAKDLEHKLGNLILMTRPLRRQSQRPNLSLSLKHSHNLSRGKLVSTETPKETCRLWSCASASAQLKQCIIKYATYVPSTAHFPPVCVCVHSFRAHLSRRHVNMPKLPLETCIELQICVPSTLYYPGLTH